MKKNLLIIPSGVDALFQEWSGDYNTHNFDLAVINWSGAELKNTESATYVENIPGWKWKIIAEFVKRHDVSQYEYIWCLDDDCLTVPELVSATFDFCKENNLDMAQPALTPDSFYSHLPTVLIDGASMHITNTVEIMCPIFSQRAWQETVAGYAEMPTGIGYGLEGYWEGMLGSATGTTKFGGRVAVIDQYPVKHIKPVTTNAQFKARGLDPDIDGLYFYNMGYPWTFTTIEVVKETA